MTKQPEEVKAFAAWRIYDKYDNVIKFGIDDFPIEFDLDKLPDGWCGERSIDKIQKEMRDKPQWKQNGFKFEYDLYTVNKDMKIKKV